MANAIVLGSGPEEFRGGGADALTGVIQLHVRDMNYPNPPNFLEG